MPGFFYFLEVSPNDIVAGGELHRGQLHAYGLDGILADCVDVPDHCMVTDCRTGPSGNPGVVLYPKSPSAESPLDWAYNPGHQTWQRVDRSESLWIGYETARPPTPDALERREVLRGYVCHDKLDQGWHVPVARSPVGAASIPSEFRRTAAGVERIPDRKWRSLWDLAGQVHDWLHDHWQPANQDVWKYDTAVTILQVNYRVGAAELNLLQDIDRSVLTSETIDPILCALVDNDLPQRLREYLQKKSGV